MSSQGTEVSKIANQAAVFLSQGSEPLYKQKNNKCCLFNLVEHHIQQPFQSYTIFSCKSSGRCCSRCSNPPTLPLTKGPPPGGDCCQFSLYFVFFSKPQTLNSNAFFCIQLQEFYKSEPTFFATPHRAPGGHCCHVFPLCFVFVSKP
jgi:hypothetical protein